MEYVVLGLLLIRSQTLYELNQSFKQGISLFYSASLGSLQKTLKSLLARGMVSFEEQVVKGRNKKIYSISEGGQKAFSAWMVDDFPASKLEVVALARVYFLGLFEDPQQKKQILSLILHKVQSSKAALERLNEAIKSYEIPPAYQPILKYQLKTLDYGIQSHAFARDWFAALLHELD